MWNRPHLGRVSWSLVDQGLVSIGTFLVSVLLARSLPATEYGAFAMLLGGMLTLQLVNGMLVFHPLSVRLVVADAGGQRRLLRASLLFTLVLTVALGAVLGVVLLWAGRPDLVLPAFGAFLFWQAQEALRRGLLSTFRFRAAALGDGLSYVGRAVAVIALMSWDLLSLSSALYVMAGTSAAAALLQAAQLDLRRSGPLDLRAAAADFWSIGGFWSLGNGMLLHGRAQALFWLLAALAGAAEVAAFQAAQNVVNLMNPLLIGLCNIVPQAASQASVHGPGAAWRATRGHALLVLPPIIAYSVIILAIPGPVLHLLYGEGSAYLDLSLAVRLLTIAALLSYGADVVMSYLYGLGMPRPAFSTTAVGAAVSAVLALPLIGAFGMLGTCAVHLCANAARLLMSHLVVARLLRREGRARMVPGCPSATGGAD